MPAITSLDAQRAAATLGAEIDLECDIDATGANALFASLAAADLPRLRRLSVGIKCEGPGGRKIDLTPLRSAAWAAQLESLSLTFEGFNVNFSAFSHLEFNVCTTLSLKGCSGKNMTALARFLSSERCSNVRTLKLSAIEASPSTFPKLLPCTLPGLEELTVDCTKGMALCVLTALASATLPTLRSAEIKAPSDSICTALESAPWLKTVHDLVVGPVSAAGLNALLAGAAGGALRTLRVELHSFDDAFAGANLPHLHELHIKSEEQWEPVNATALLSSRRLPALQDLWFRGPYVHPVDPGVAEELEIPAAFADHDVLPALKNLWLIDLQPSLAGAAALGRRLPRLTTLKLGAPQPGESSEVFAALFGAAAVFVGEWALEVLTVGEYNIGLSLEIIDGQPDMCAMDALLGAAPGMTRLRELRVNGTLGAAGARLWAQAAAQGLWPRLDFLLVGNVRWGGVRELAGKLGGFTALKELEIYLDSDGDSDADSDGGAESEPEPGSAAEGGASGDGDADEDDHFPGIAVGLQSARDRWIFF